MMYSGVISVGIRSLKISVQTADLRIILYTSMIKICRSCSSVARERTHKAQSRSVPFNISICGNLSSGLYFDWHVHAYCQRGYAMTDELCYKASQRDKNRQMI